MNHLVEQGTRLLMGTATGEPAARPKNMGVTMATLGVFSIGAAWTWSTLEHRRARRLRLMAELVESSDALVVVE